MISQYLSLFQRRLRMPWSYIPIIPLERLMWKKTASIYLANNHPSQLIMLTYIYEPCRTVPNAFYEYNNCCAPFFVGPCNNKIQFLLGEYTKLIFIKLCLWMISLFKIQELKWCRNWAARCLWSFWSKPCKERHRWKSLGSQGCKNWGLPGERHSRWRDLARSICLLSWAPADCRCHHCTAPSRLYQIMVIVAIFIT